MTLLNSLNSIDLDKIQNKLGCWGYLKSGNRYMARRRSKSFFIVTWGRGTIQQGQCVSYQPKDNLINVFSVTVADNVSTAKLVIPLVFGFFHDSLNSAKFN